VCSADAQYNPRGKGHAHSELAAERNEVAASQRSTRNAFAEVMRSALVTHENTQHAKWSLMLLNSWSFAASMEKAATCCAALRNYDSGQCLSGYCLCLALAGTQYIPLLSDSHCSPLAVKVPIGCWACVDVAIDYGEGSTCVRSQHCRIHRAKPSGSRPAARTSLQINVEDRYAERVR